MLRRDEDGKSVLEARPITGRTNQIRVHLWHMDMPVCSEAMYQSGRQLGDMQTLSMDATPLCLHAWRLGFHHPITKKPITFETESPDWF